MSTDGQTYEHVKIAKWFALGNMTSPLTGEEMPSTNLLPNIALCHKSSEKVGCFDRDDVRQGWTSSSVRSRLMCRPVICKLCNLFHTVQTK